MEQYIDILKYLITKGVTVTLQITAVAYLFSLCFGLLIGLARTARNPFLRGGARVYVEFIRAIPLLVQLIYIYFVIQPLFRELLESMVMSEFFLFNMQVFGFSMNSVMQGLLDLFDRSALFVSGVATLVICFAAYMAEIFRAGIQSIEYGQVEAALSSGLTMGQAMRHVVLPQAIRRVVPPLGNEFVAMLKDSSIISIIGLRELTRAGREIVSSTFLTFEVWTMVAILYFLITSSFSFLMNRIERRFKYDQR